ncbi:hypothetical protein D3C84_846730 [compost metagenome]
MFGGHQQTRLGVEAAFAVEQRLQAGAFAVGQYTADDRRSLLGDILKLGHATGDDDRLGAAVNGLTGFGNCRIRAERSDGFTLAGDQHQVVGLGRGGRAFGEGVDQADD